MVARFVGQALNHQTPAAIWDYQIRDHRAMGYGDRVPLYRGDGTFLSWINRDQYIALSNGIGLNGERLRRPNTVTLADGRKLDRSQPGDLLSFSLPSTVRGGMKLVGRLDTPHDAFSLLEPQAVRAMRGLNKQAFGRTTNGQAVKSDLLYCIFKGQANRAGEVDPRLEVYVFNTALQPDGKHMALAFRPLYRAQKAVSADYHMGVASELHRKHGLLFGPKGHSFYARGVGVQTRRSKQMRRHLKSSRHRGPAARTAAAKRTRGPKKKTTWAASVAALNARAKGKVSWAHRAWSERREEKFARKCVAAAFHYCNQTNSRYSTADVYTTGAHLALPHVRPDVYAKAFDAARQCPERYGAEVVKIHPDGNLLLAPAGHLKAQKQAAAVIGAWATQKGGGLSRKQVAKGLAGLGLTVGHYTAVQDLAADSRASVLPNALKDPTALKLLARAYAAAGRDVYAVGAAAGKAMGVPAHSAHGLAENICRVGHLKSLWRGLRTPGSLSERLFVAQTIRAYGHLKIGHGSLVVAAINDAREAKAVARIAHAVGKAGGRLLVTGPGADQLVDLMPQRTQAAGARRGAHP